MFVSLFIIIAVINYSECRRCHSHGSLRFLDHYASEESNETEEIFESIADFIADIDEELEKTCRFESITALDKYDENGYTRKIILAGFNADTVSVKIKQRVLYTKVDHLYMGRRSLIDIKILPLNLNTTEADFEIKNDALYVNIPYVDLDFCSHRIYENVFNVPRKLLLENPYDSQHNNQENANYDIDPVYWRYQNLRKDGN